MSLRRATLTIVALAFLALTALADSGIVSVTVASLRSQPSHSSELETQALMGTPVDLYEQQGEWVMAKLPNGYRAWLNQSAFVRMTYAEMQQWRRAPRVIVTAPTLQYVTSTQADPSPSNIVTDMVYGCVLSVVSVDGPWTLVALPNGTQGWLPTTSVVDFGEFAKVSWSADRALAYAFMLRGTTYLWGANSLKFVDCSGFTSICYAMCGLQLPRNASQQALVGVKVDWKDYSDNAMLRPGDLVFFSNPTTGKVNHVGMVYNRDGGVIHASGQVKVNTLSAEDPDLGRRVVSGVRRILGTTSAETLRFANLTEWFDN